MVFSHKSLVEEWLFFRVFNKESKFCLEIGIFSSVVEFLDNIHFIHSTIKVSKYYFVFSSLIFIFHIVLQSFKEMCPSQLFPGAIPWRGINTENYVIRGSRVTFKDTNFSFGSVSISVIPSRDEAGQAIPLCDHLEDRKR